MARATGYMARATGYICDRCGAAIDKWSEVTEVGVEDRPRGRSMSSALYKTTNDLCPLCAGALKRFMKNEDVGHGSTTFEEHETPCPHRVTCASPCGETVLRRVCR